MIQLRAAAALAALLLLPSAAAAGQSDDILMGSVVKSESWSMDRNTNTENFKGNVSFSNPGYSLRADEAVYYRGQREWRVKGGVAVRRLLEDGATVDLSCDRGRYAEDGDRAQLFRGTEPVRAVYTNTDARVLRSRSDRLLASGAENRMIFEKDFSLASENIIIFSSRAVYDNAAASFMITGDRPVAAGVNEEYNFAMSAENLLFFRDSRDMKASGGVKGWVKDKEASGETPR